jgi:lipocalin
MERIDNPFQANGECVIAFYRAEEDGSVFVRNAQVQQDGSIYSEEGFAVLAYPEIGNGVLNVTFPTQPILHPNYFILDTDYTSYAIVWNCLQISSAIKSESVWIFQRNDRRQPTRPVSVQAIIDKHFSSFEFRPTYQASTCISRVGIDN